MENSSTNVKKSDKINQNDPQETLEVERKGDINRLTSSPLHYENGEHRAPQQNTGSNHSIEQSPLHPHSRVGRKGSAASSPSWNKKGSSEGSHGIAPSTPGRSRLRSVTRGDETPEHIPAVPKFGDWDDTDPASAEGYSGIFTKVREERQSGGGRVPVMPTETSDSSVPRQYGNQNEKMAINLNLIVPPEDVDSFDRDIFMNFNAILAPRPRMMTTEDDVIVCSPRTFAAAKLRRILQVVDLKAKDTIRIYLPNAQH